jgi:hypothetical protein
VDESLWSIARDGLEAMSKVGGKGSKLPRKEEEKKKRRTI